MSLEASKVGNALGGEERSGHCPMILPSIAVRGKDTIPKKGIAHFAKFHAFDEKFEVAR